MTNSRHKLCNIVLIRNGHNAVQWEIVEQAQFIYNHTLSHLSPIICEMFFHTAVIVLFEYLC